MAQQNETAVDSLMRPAIVDRVNQIPMINMAVNVSFTQYGKLKQSNVTVGNVISKAEQFAFFMWGSVQPIVTKFQQPRKYTKPSNY